MESSKDHVTMKQPKTSQEKDLEKRKRHAEAQKRYRDKKGNLKRSELCSKDIDRLRELDLKSKKKKRAKMTKEEKDFARAKDRESKAKKKKVIKEIERVEAERIAKNKEVNSYPCDKRKLRLKKQNDRIQRMIRDGRTEEEKEKRNAGQAAMMREMRREFTKFGRTLARRKARRGMRVSRKLGYLEKYKQRKSRCEEDAFECRWNWDTVDKNGYTWTFKERMEKYLRMYRKKHGVAELEKKENLKRMNRVRVQRHRLKVKKMLEEPVLIDTYGAMGEYELIRERNIRELERLKKESGLFD